MNSRITQNSLLLAALGVPALLFAILLYYRAPVVPGPLHASVSRLITQLSAAHSRLDLRIALAHIDRAGVRPEPADAAAVQAMADDLATIAGLEQRLSAASRRLAQDLHDNRLHDQFQRYIADAANKARLTEAFERLLRSGDATRAELDRGASAALAVPTVARLGELRLLYDASYQQLTDAGERHRAMLLAYFALLLLIGLYFAQRWRNQERLRLLETSRQQLEERVNNRTQELRKAYQELQQSQGRLVQSEKMSALGQMVAGVAHEINTPLAYSRSNVVIVQELLAELQTLVNHCGQQARLLKNAGGEGRAKALAQIAKVAKLGETLQADSVTEEAAELLQASVDGLDQISEMVMTLKNFSRVDRKKTELFNLNEGLESALRIANNKLKYGITVVRQLNDIPPVTCSPSQINQVFLNLLVNAAQAIDGEGTITVSSFDCGDHVDIVIEDDGPGIPDDVMPHIFDPFYTTKDVGEGTGLGLSICYQIVDQHGGTISVDSTVGVGTRFTLSLFVSEHSHDAVADRPVAPSQTARGRDNLAIP